MLNELTECDFNAHFSAPNPSSESSVLRNLQDDILMRAPEHPVVYDAAPDRPQPRFDLDRGNGMTVSVGRLRPCGVLDYKFTVLSHNTIRGAAGAALLNAELLKVQGYLS
jgi:aspartate-semialdehyde dehydrogenase